VVLYAIAIDPKQPISMELSAGAAKAADEAVERILAELASKLRRLTTWRARSTSLSLASALRVFARLGKFPCRG